MSKLMRSLGLLSAMLLSAGATFGADDETKPKKGKLDSLKEKFGGKFGGTGMKMSAEQREKLFEKLDANSDGKISKEEFEKFTEKSGQGKLGSLTGRMFERLDADSDGYLSKKEFEKLGSGMSGGFDKLKDKFGGLDKLKEKFKGKFGERKKEKKDD